MIKPEQDTALLDTVRLFYNILSSEERALIRKNSTFREYKRNEFLFWEGNTPIEFMCLVKGEVKIAKRGISCRGHIVRMIKPVSFFGYRAFFANERYITSAIANSDVRVLTIPNSIMRVLLQSNNNLTLRFLQYLAAELRFSDERTISLTQKHVRGRLAETIIVLRDLYGVDKDGASLSIIMSREDLAEFSNMTTSNCIRTISAFVSERVIAVDGRRIKVLNFDELEKISQLGK